MSTVPISVKSCMGFRRSRAKSTALKPCLSIALEELDPVELAVLRLSTWELIKRVDVPYRVVINEGVELAKVFGATDGHKFVNGVLDKLAPALREAEVKANKR
jgi:Transcription termination factor